MVKKIKDLKTGEIFHWEGIYYRKGDRSLDGYFQCEPIPFHMLFHENTEVNVDEEDEKNATDS